MYPRWTLSAVALGAGWVVYGLTSGGRVFLVVMVVLSMIMFSVVGVVFRRRSGA